MSGQDSQAKELYPTEKKVESTGDPVEPLINLVADFKQEHRELFETPPLSEMDKAAREENARQLEPESLRNWRQLLTDKLRFRLKNKVGSELSPDSGEAEKVFADFFPKNPIDEWGKTQKVFYLLSRYNIFNHAFGVSLLQKLGVYEPGEEHLPDNVQLIEDPRRKHINFTRPLDTGIEGLKAIFCLNPETDREGRYVASAGTYGQILLLLTPKALKELVSEKAERLPGRQNDNQRPEAQEAILSDQEVVWSEGKGREGNLTEVLEAHQISHPEFWQNLKGKQVLIKLNLVDPDYSHCCTHPASLKIVMDNLAKHDVGEVLIGDESSADYLDKHPGETPEAIFRKLGYSMPPGMNYRLIDFSKLDQVALSPSGPNIRKLPEVAAIFNLVTPKEHGQYYFSCGCKNLIGLVPAGERRAFFHDHLSQVNKVREELSAKGLYKGPEDEVKIWIEAAKRNDPKNMEKMAGFVKAFVAHLKERNISLLTIVDGKTIQRSHEHNGSHENLDIAGIGLDPVAVDRAAVEKLGVSDNDVGYLEMMAAGHQPTVSGEMRKLPPRSLIRIVDPNSVTVLPSGEVKFRFIIR